MTEEANRESKTQAGVARFSNTMTIVMLLVSPSVSGRPSLSGELVTEFLFYRLLSSTDHSQFPAEFIPCKPRQFHTSWDQQNSHLLL